MNRQEQFERFHKSWMEINAAYEQYARDIGVSYAQLQVLCELYHAPSGMTQKELCEVCHLPKTTVNAMISGLAKQGQIELEEVPEDRRQKTILLTEAGRSYAAPIMEHMSESEQKAFERLDESTILTMLKGIEAFQKSFHKNLNGGDPNGEF